MTVSLSPRNWAVVFSPRRRFRTPRTPLDTVDSLDDNKFNQVMNVCTPRPGRKVCDHCGTVAASARLHCVRGTSRFEDESNDYHISLCEYCMKKEDRGELKSQLRTARHAKLQQQRPRDSMRVRKVEKMKIKMKQFWKDMLSFFSKYDDDEDSEERAESMKDLQELDQHLSASFHDWIMKNSLRKSKKGNNKGSVKAASIAEGAEALFEAESPKTARRTDRDVVREEEDLSPSDDSAAAPLPSWKQWGLLTRGKKTNSSRSNQKRKKISCTSNSSNSNSDSSFFSVWPNCFGS